MSILILRSSVVAEASQFSHGDSVAISGSGFGSHALDIYFIGGAGGVIESNAVDATPSDTAVWTYDGIDQGVDLWGIPVGFDDATRGRVLRTAYNEASAVDLSVGWEYPTAIPANTRVYINEYARLSPFDRVGGTVTQWKLIRFRGTFGVADNPTAGDAYIANWINDYDNAFVDFQGGSGGFESINGDGSTAFDGSSLPADGGEWHRLEWLINHGGNASAICDSDVRVSREGSFCHRLVSTLQNFTFNRSIPNVIFQSYLGVGGFGGSIGSTTRVSHDDLYVQVGTFKRVELCDNATLSNATWREIQPPDAWDDDEVTVTLNTGAGRTGTLWLHVVGEDGSSLGSREITVN